MKAGLGLSTDTQQWVVDGYLITFGGLLLLASRASDLFGRRRVFQLGLVVFSAASLLGGLSQDGVMLLAARFIQGAGAAALGPASLSLITASHPDPDGRANALKWWGVAAASAGAVGVVLGGVLTAALNWRWVFFVNVPIGVVLLSATYASLEPSGAKSDGQRVDIPGAATITIAVAAIVYGVSSAPDHGWGSGQVIAAIAVGVVLLAAFVLIERRIREPLIPLGLFAARNIKVGNVLIVCLGIIITSPLFFLSLYLQQALGDSALTAGLALLPMAAVLSLGVIASQKLTPRLGPKRLLISGGVVAAVGLVWLAQLPTHSHYVSHVLLPTLVVGVGMSVMLLPMTVAATTGVDPRNAGVASGLINMGRQIGGALGLAGLVTVASTAARHSNAPGAGPIVHGYHTALLVVAAVSIIAVAVALLLQTGADAPITRMEEDEAEAMA